MAVLTLLSTSAATVYAQTELCASGPAGSGGLSNKAPLGAGSVTLGCNHANRANGILFGNNSVLIGTDGVALYLTTTTANANNVVSNGENTFYDASNVSNIGNGTVVNAGGSGTTNLGANNTFNGANGAVAGNNTTINGANVVSVGNGNTINGANATVFGSGVSAVAAGGTAIGNGASANNANDVALGSGSSSAAAVGTAGVTLNGTGYTFAGTAPTSTVSVGAAGAERTITNVAAGRLSATSTDAINGSQLHATNTALAVTDARVTTLDNRVTNIAGDTSTTYTNVNGIGIRYARTNEAGLPAIDSYATGAGSTAVGYGAKSEGTNSLALGNGAVATNANDIALGAGTTTAAAVATTGAVIDGNSYTFAGTAPTSTMSVGSVGAERTITNVAAGRVSATSTDAINGSQLFATNTAIEKLSDRAVKYDLNPDGTVNYTHTTMAGPVSTDGGKTGGTTISNVHQGAVNATSTDAINGAQLYNIAGDTSTTYTTTNGRGIRYARTNDAGLVESDAFAQGQGSTAVGYGATTTSNATNAVALGNGATASYAGAVAIGSGSVASGPGVSVSGTTINGQTYVFAGQNAGSQGVVSVGSVGNERQITNVAAGQLTSTSTDAVNGSQLFATNTAINSLGNKVNVIDARVTVLDDRAVKYDINKDGTVNYNSVTLGNGKPDSGSTTIGNVADGVADTDAVNVGQLNKLNKNINGGIAGAMAMASMPQANEVGKTMASAGIGYYNGGSSLAVGASRMSDNGRWVIKGGVSIGTGKVGMAAGAGMNF
jgi:autotransporter adhesin